jgi:hypothetical protein
MFCDKCGSTLHAGAQACGVCGKQVIETARPFVTPGAGAAAASQAMPVAMQVQAAERVRKNIQLLSTLWLVYGILRLLSIVWITIFGQVILPSILSAIPDTGWGNWASGDWGWPFGSWILLPASFFAAVFGVAYLILAWALREQRPWARTYGIVLGILVLFRIPFGTALGVYTLWVLLPENSRREYQQLAQGA